MTVTDIQLPGYGTDLNCETVSDYSQYTNSKIEKVRCFIQKVCLQILKLPYKVPIPA